MPSGLMLGAVLGCAIGMVCHVVGLEQAEEPQAGLATHLVTGAVWGTSLGLASSWCGIAVQRRVKGLFRDAGIDAVRRRRWPVVVAGEDVVWIPGVRRALAASARSGRPTITFRCERFDR